MNPFRKLKGVVMSKLLAVAVRKLAEGDFGSGPARIYWWASGKKTWTAAIMAGAAVALSTAHDVGACDPCAGWVAGLVTVAGVLAAVGLFDAAVRIEPPSRPRDTVGRR